MDEDQVTVLQLSKGSDLGGVQLVGLNEAQLAGRACLVCAGEDEPDAMVGVGLFGEVRAKVHRYHVEAFRMGEYEAPVRRV